MDKAAKIILNSLRCPICKSQIDLIDWTRANMPRTSNFSCVSVPDHFGIWFVHWDGPPVIERETVIVNEGFYQYKIVQKSNFVFANNHTTVSHLTELLISDIDAEQRLIEGSVSKFLRFPKHLFDFQKTNKEKLINRIKTILVFQ